MGNLVVRCFEMFANFSPGTSQSPLCVVADAWQVFFLAPPPPPLCILEEYQNLKKHQKHQNAFNLKLVFKNI